MPRLSVAGLADHDARFSLVGALRAPRKGVKVFEPVAAVAPKEAEIDLPLPVSSLDPTNDRRLAGNPQATIGAPTPINCTGRSPAERIGVTH